MTTTYLLFKKKHIGMHVNPFFPYQTLLYYSSPWTICNLRNVLSYLELEILVPSIQYNSQLSQACSDRKKSPSEFDNKIENCSHQTTIFHWNWKEKLRFVGFITWLTQPIRPKLGGNFCRCTTSPPTNLNFSFQFQWKMVVWWLQFTILLSNVLGLFFSITTCLGHLWYVESRSQQGPLPLAAFIISNSRWWWWWRYSFKIR